MKKIVQNFIGAVVILMAVSIIFSLVNSWQSQSQHISFTQFVKDLQAQKIKSIEVENDDVFLTYKNDKQFTTRKESNVGLIEELKAYGVEPQSLQGVELTIRKPKQGLVDWLIPLLTFFLPLVLFGWFFWMMFKQARSGANQTFNFLKPPAKVFNGQIRGEKITFDDIADLQEAKEEIKEIVEFLKNPRKFWKMGARIPKGVLLVGPPGTGKTMLARAVATEAGVPFFSMVGSEFVELFVGVGASRTRQLFETAKRHQPSIIFIDELDAIGKVRLPGIGGGHEEREQTLNQILAEMDGFEKETGVIVLAATNRPEQLDPALLRPGRFDRRIVLDLPDVNGREAILKIHCRQKPLAEGVNLREVAERTPGFSGADLANLVNEAAILAAKKNQQKIFQRDFLESIDKVLLGPERKSHLLTEKEKEISAYHEAGHAIVSHFLPEAEEVRKISIVARGFAAGYTLSLPKREKKIKTKSEFIAEIAVLLGGYCAEKIKFGEITTGAANDLEKATTLARNLVTRFGMSRLGPITFGKREQMPFLGWETESEKNYSEKVAAEIDKEVKRFIDTAQKKAMALLRQKKNILERVAKTLIQKETIEKEEFEKLVGSITIKKRNKKQV